MNYEDMTLAQLHAIVEERKLRLSTKKMKKADLIAVLKESEKIVEAEVIEDQNSLAVSLVPGKLHANFAMLDKRIDDILATYEGWEPTGESIEELKEVARSRKYLNSLAKELDERRKEIKREYLRPLDELEGMFNARRDRIKAVSARLQTVEKEADEAYRVAKKNELREHFECVAGLLAEVVPYDRVADPKWLNKTVNVVAAKKELEEKCRKVAADWETLKGLGLEFSDEAELRFFETLDLGDATSYATKLAEDKRRLEAMKAEREAYMQPEPAPEPIVEPAPVMMPVPGLTLESAPVMQPVPYSEPQPVIEPYAQPVPVTNERETLMQQIEAALEKYETKQLNNLAEGLEIGLKERRGLMEPRLMVIEAATIDQLQAIGKICGMFGVTGAFQSGPLAQNLVNEMKSKRG